MNEFGPPIDHEKEMLRHLVKKQSATIARLEAENAALKAEVERLRESDRAIFNALNGKVCDPDPLKPLWYGPALITPTTYGLAAGLLRERDALRAELADLKDGLTAAHMDGFASGKAEATEMLRKREGQLEELRAEVKAYREVEDSLQKEIKRLDKEVASLTQELEEARSMIQWERGAKNGAYELIEQQDKLKAENAALREEAALYQKEWAILRAEVERFRAENAQLKCNFSPILHFAKQEQEKRGEPSVVIDSEGIPIENAVLRRNYITLRSQLEQAEGELAECRGKVEKTEELMERRFCENGPYDYIGLLLKQILK